MTLELVNKCKHLVVSYILHNFDKEIVVRSEEHTSELQSQSNLVCRLLLEKKNISRELSLKLGIAISLATYQASQKVIQPIIYDTAYHTFTISLSLRASLIAISSNIYVTDA